MPNEAAGLSGVKKVQRFHFKGHVLEKICLGLIFQSRYGESPLEEEHNLPSYVEILCVLVISYQTMEQ